MKINNSTINYLNNSTKRNTNQNNKYVSFGSATSEVTKAVSNEASGILEKLLAKATNNSLVKKLSAKVGMSDKGISNLLMLDSVILSSFYVINTGTNKKIKKDQKLPLIINQALVFGLSTALTLTVDKIIKEKVDNFRDAFKTISLKKFKDQPADVLKKATKRIETTSKGIDIIKSVVIFGMIYRFFSPVVVTPIANKLSAKIQHRKDAEKAAAAQTSGTQVPVDTTKKV